MRGQTLPAWLASTVFTAVSAAFILSFANTIAYQMRAQAAADSVASAAVALQAQEFNQINEGLYATGVEEYRLRHLLESIRLLDSYAGGCYATPPAAPPTQMSPQLVCQKTYGSVVAAYRRALTHYDQDARFLNSVSYNMDPDTLKSDVRNLVTHINQACQNNTKNSGYYTYCSQTDSLTFKYNIVGLQSRGNLKNAIATANTNELPSYANTGAILGGGLNPIFAPLEVEIAVCTTVPSVFPLLTFTKPVTVVARAAATNVMLEQDWLQPGQNGLQPEEIYGPDENGSTTLPSAAPNWYSVDFGGNPAQTTWPAIIPNSTPATQSSITSLVNKEEFSARTGWWGPAPILPFTTQSADSLKSGCAS